MELTIDHLTLNLPPTLAERAEPIARALGDELARLPLSQSLSLGQLRVPPLTVHPQHSDQQIARDIARAVHGQLKGCR